MRRPAHGSAGRGAWAAGTTMGMGAEGRPQARSGGERGALGGGGWAQGAAARGIEGRERGEAS